MTSKSINERKQAKSDMDAALDYYLREGGVSATMGFLDALERVYRDIAQYPGAGSTRYGDLLGMADLRSRALGRYPYVVLYVEGADRVDVWRVVHGRRDIPPLMQEP